MILTLFDFIAVSPGCVVTKSLGVASAQTGKCKTTAKPAESLARDGNSLGARESEI
jgi:hypothetical protein